MTIDWSKHALAMQCSRDGNDAKALSVLAELMKDAETNRDKSAILLAQASCYSRRGELDKSLELIVQAKLYSGSERDLLLHVARCEASVHALKREFNLACEEYVRLRAEYQDLLQQDEDSSVEVDSRFACTLVDARRYQESIPIFRSLFSRDGIEDLQRLELYFGIALGNCGDAAEGRQFLLRAAKGSDLLLVESALEHLDASILPQ